MPVPVLGPLDHPAPESCRHTEQEAVTAIDNTVEPDAVIPPANEAIHATADSLAALKPSLKSKSADQKSTIRPKGKKRRTQVEEPIAGGSGFAPPVNQPLSPTIDLASQAQGTGEHTDGSLPTNGDTTSLVPLGTSAIDAAQTKKRKKKADGESSAATRKNKKIRLAAQGVAAGDESAINGSKDLQAGGSGSMELSEHRDQSAAAKPMKRTLKISVPIEAQSLLLRQAMEEALGSLNTLRAVSPSRDSPPVLGEAGAEGSTRVAKLVIDSRDNEAGQDEQRQKPFRTKRTSKKSKSKQPVAVELMESGREVPTVPSADPTDLPLDVSDSLVVAAPHIEKGKPVKKKPKKGTAVRKAKSKAPEPVITMATRESEHLEYGHVEMEGVDQLASLPDSQTPIIITKELVPQSSPCLDSIRSAKKFVPPLDSLTRGRAPEPNWAALAGRSSSTAIATNGGSSLRVDISASSSIAVASSSTGDQEGETNNEPNAPGKPARIPRRFSSIEAENIEKNNLEEEETWDMGLQSPEVEGLPVYGKKQKQIASSRTSESPKEREFTPGSPQQSSLDADGGSTTAVQSQPDRACGKNVRSKSLVASVHPSDGMARPMTWGNEVSKSTGDDSQVMRTTAGATRSASPLDLSLAAKPLHQAVEQAKLSESRQQGGEREDDVEDDDVVGGEVLIPASQLSPKAVGKTKLTGLPLMQTEATPAFPSKRSGHRQRPSIPGWDPILESSQPAPSIQSQSSIESLVDQLPGSEGEESDEAVIDESLKASSPLKSPSSRRPSESDTDFNEEGSRRDQPFPKLLPQTTLGTKATGSNAMSASFPFPNGVHGVRPGHGLRTSLQNNSKTPLPANTLRGGLNRTQSASPYPSLNGLVSKQQSASQPATQRAPLRTPARKTQTQDEESSEDSTSGSSNEDDDKTVPENRRAGAGLNQSKQRRSRLAAFE
ncbi:hypothetical protein FRB98_000524 [Tulasnella sp. 332]|nr:hypothetical protein FRB98_000524 [Tulasnella sp. 332]